jgi:S-adenosyl-L-methionine hydrolase (adenosine-forming)
MARPVIALLTDFGLRDHYVAAMKAVMLGICPEVTFLDISHDIAAQDIVGGALELEAVVRYLPAGTVVLGVVDPGVGSERRGVVIESGSLRFVGPDNGLFTLATDVLGGANAVALERVRFARERVSRTFEGRDRFAPAAAWLATGTPVFEMGRAIADLVRLAIDEPVTDANRIDGAVLRVDYFGNLVTNISDAALRSLDGGVSIDVAGATIDGMSATYAEAAPGALCAVIGSTDRLEISVSGGSAAAVLGASRGTAVQVRARQGA